MGLMYSGRAQAKKGSQAQLTFRVRTHTFPQAQWHDRVRMYVCMKYAQPHEHSIQFVQARVAINEICCTCALVRWPSCACAATCWSIIKARPTTPVTQADANLAIMSVPVNIIFCVLDLKTHVAH